MPRCGAVWLDPAEPDSMPACSPPAWAIRCHGHAVLANRLLPGTAMQHTAPVSGFWPARLVMRISRSIPAWSQRLPSQKTKTFRPAEASSASACPFSSVKPIRSSGRRHRTSCPVISATGIQTAGPHLAAGVGANPVSAPKGRPVSPRHPVFATTRTVSSKPNSSRYGCIR